MKIEKTFDADRLDMLFGRDRSMVDEIVEIVLEDYPVSVGKLKVAIAEEDLEKIATIAHTLKGSLANVGGDQSSKTAKYINDAAKLGALKECRNALPIFEREIEQFYKELKEYQGSL